MSSDYRDDDFSEDDDLESEYGDRPGNDDDIEIPRIGKNNDPGPGKDDDFDDDFFKDEDFEFADYSSDDVEGRGYRSKRIREKRKRRKLIYTSLAIFLIIVVVAAAIVFGYRWIRNRFFSPTEVAEEERISVPETLELNQDLNIVISGAGEDLLEPEVNSIIFTSYYSTGNETRSICMPVKTLMDVPGIGAELIGRSVGIGGMDLLSLTLEKGLGMDMQIDQYLLMDVKNIVDRLGGMELEMDQAYVINDYSNDSTFTLEPGPNLIDGSEAVNILIYFSGIEKDIPLKDMKIQKKVMDTMISRIAGEDDESLADNLNQVKDYIDSDLSLEELLKLFSTFAGIAPEDNIVYTLEASSTELEGEGIVYLPDVAGLSDLFSKEETVLEEEAVAERTVEVTILNGVGTPGIAAELSDILNSQLYESGKNKFNVAEVGNADNFNYASTEIVVYTSDESAVMNAANDLKEILSGGNITTGQDEIAGSDIVIILGADYNPGTAAETEPVQVSGIVDVAVLNGAGAAGIAGRTSEELEEHFNADRKIIEIVEVTDADNYNYTQTEIITYTDEEGIEALAQQIQDKMGVGVIKKGDSSDYGEDITIIIGSDYTSQ
jgi:polyisoprenyl-teichoic acid--peptidoglycan teichoic acid transferase